MFFLLQVVFTIQLFYFTPKAVISQECGVDFMRKIGYNPEFDSYREAESQKSLENSRFFGSL